MRGEVTVWWGSLDRHDAGRFEPLLSPDERGRAATFRFARGRSRYVVARGLLRMILGERLAIAPDRVELTYGNLGKPRLAGDHRLRFNLAHSGDVLAVALCEGREVGLDVEAVREDLFAEGIARRYLPAEVAAEIERHAGTERLRRFYRAWVRQEAYAKARGAGLELIGENPDPDGWSLIDLESPDGFAGALAIEGGKELVAGAAGVGHTGGEIGQAVDVVLAGTPKPIR
jgi:4'-phosphopantetheinyl transferase